MKLLNVLGTAATDLNSLGTRADFGVKFASGNARRNNPCEYVDAM